MSNEIKLDFYTVIRHLPISLNEDENQKRLAWFESLIEQILHLSNSEMTITRMYNEEQLDEVVDSERKTMYWLQMQSIILKFCCALKPDSIEILPKNLVEPLRNISDELSMPMKIFYCKDKIKNLMVDLVTCCHILMPGMLSIDKIYIYKNNNFNQIINMFIPFNSVQNFAFTFLPKLAPLCEKNLNILNVLEWFNEIKMKENDSETTEDDSVKRLHRVVGFLNRLLVERDYASSIIWLGAAIEILFCAKDEWKINSKIKERAKLLFPKLKITEENLENIYNCRSELLHGSQDFDIYPPQLITLTYSSKKSGERDEMAENFCSAAYLFFETLQFMVHKKLWSLQPILSSLQKEATSK